MLCGQVLSGWACLFNGNDGEARLNNGNCQGKEAMFKASA